MADFKFTLQGSLLEHAQGSSSYLPVVAVTVVALAVTYPFVKDLYPQPIPGIPYNKASTKTILGDVPDVGEHAKKSQSFRTWFLGQAHRHDSATTQVFLGPPSKAAVIVSDYREANGILSHRDGVDFKRGPGLKVDALRGILPHALPATETSNPDPHSSRDLARDLMTISFIPAHGRRPSHLRRRLSLAGAVAYEATRAWPRAAP
ncbi:hypothetical protein KVR01_013165 [Diaporthe batatas]|uniref:uncharacterized protein n=1 Tax=Diaporthe batatas TaxID=748121 RepID=UPI001D03B6E9|nr:uncharacterized protein KVR01_013165 [Diaporthe batatas]KAG8156943.1 hypothetical protein KVR01_013165 [Diaporthe batatas]